MTGAIDPLLWLGVPAAVLLLGAAVAVVALPDPAGVEQDPDAPTAPVRAPGARWSPR